MKLIFESEDCVVGLVFGLLLLALSGKWFSLPFARTALIIVIPIFVIVIVIDIFHELTDLSRHFMFIGASIVHNAFDFVLCAALYASFFNWSLPLIGGYVPYLENPSVLLWLGLFEVVSHVIWLVLAPFNT